ncbi:MAG: GspE/PulE family protein [Patescibacteria group bacterium]
MNNSNFNIKEKLKQIWQAGKEREAQKLAKNLNQNYLDLTTASINIEALALIPEENAKKAKALAVSLKNNNLAVAVVDLSLTETKEEIKNLEAKGFKLKIFIVSLKSFDYGFGFYKFISEKKNQITGKVGLEKEKFSEIRKKINSLKDFTELLSSAYEEKGDVAEILEIIFAGALINRASDIHLESEEKSVNLKIRVDGLMRKVFSGIEKEFYEHLLSRIKLLSGLKINIHDEPQDGRFTIEFPEKKIETRIAIAPSEFGEVIVMRLLDPDSINISLISLGLRTDDLKIIENELKKPNGLILNTGPTGSGKTTTLYAFLSHKKNPEIKLITIEDPIEYHMEGIEQTQVDAESGYTFATGLRSLMRQDPDVILVGEIRDKETAEIGIQAALTGHLVFSTIHANASSGAIPRLLDLGVKATSIGPALNLIIGQRLVRRLCPDCKKTKSIEPDLESKIRSFLKKLPSRASAEQYNDIKIYEAVGCDKCGNFGYKGRIAIYELLIVDNSLEELIAQEAGEPRIQELASKQGMTTMQQDGILKTISGITTFDEVENVTGPLEWQ